MPEGYWKRTSNRRLSRRTMLRGAALGAAGLAGAALIGCGDDDDDAVATTGGATTGGATATAAAAQATAAAAGTAQVAEIPRGGTLIVGWGGQPLGLDPHFGKGGNEHKYAYMMFDNIIDYGPDGLLDPSQSLAETFEQVTPTKIILNLRPGVSIPEHDEPVDADLVKWNLERATDEGATPRTDMGAIESIDVVSTNVAVLNLNTPSAPLLTNMGDRGGFIVSRKQVELLGSEKFAREPLGSGVMKLTEWIDDVGLTFEANKGHWQKDSLGRQLPYLDKIEVKILPDSTVRVAALEAGEVDITATPSADYDRLNEMSDLQAAEFVGSSTSHFYIHHGFPPLDNLNMRKAVASAMDRETLINNFRKGIEVPTKGLLTPASWAYPESMEGFPYDPAESRKLLEASGLPESEWKITTQPFGASISQEEEFWQAGFADVGITLDWRPAERNGWQKVFMGLGGEGSAAMFWSGWSMRVDPDANIGQFLLQTGAYNSGQVAVPETEELVLKARAELDTDARKEMYLQIEQIAHDNVYSFIGGHYNITVDHAQLDVGGLDMLYGGEGKRHWHYLWKKA